MTSPDRIADMATDIERAYPGINDDGTCPHGSRYDACPTCSPTQPEDAA